MRMPALLFAVLALTTLHAQQVQKCCNNTNSSFLLGSATYARHNQGIYLPADFQNATAGNITRLYFRYGTVSIANGNVLTDLTISLLQSQQTSHIDDQFITDPIPVFNSAEYVIAPGIADQWFHIDLDQPFPYDPGSSLIVDIRFDESENLLTCRSVGTPGRKLATGDPLSLVGTTSSTNLHDIGFDFDQPTGMPSQGPMVTMLYPNPTSGILDLLLDQPVQGSFTVEIRDAQGKVVQQGTINGGVDKITSDVSALAPGMYLIRLVNDHGDGMARSFLRQ